jgi:membrane protein
MSLTVFTILGTTYKRFNGDKCWNSAIIISYFAFLCSVPVVSLFVYLTTKIVGTSEFALRSLNLFSDEFFGNLGWFGLIGTFVAASFLFSNLIHTINLIFRAKYERSFVYNRLIEYSIMFAMGVILLISLAITAIWTALHRTLQESTYVATHLNPRVIALVDNFLVQYLVPLALTFLAFFTLYKFIPEIKVHTRCAALAAVVGAVLWEAFKRIFAFYVAHFSAIGIVLSRLVQGTLTSIIFFLLWISFSLAILLWGAELAAVLNERRQARNA